VPSTPCRSVSEKSDRPKLELHHRPVEIERKFLVANNGWRQSAVRSVGIRDGLIAVYKDRKVRVRISGDIATIAIKGPRIGIVRPEFEYEIPIADAERMLSTLCQDDTLEKQRFFVEEARARGRLMFTAAFLRASQLPKSSSSKKARSWSSHFGLVRK